MNIQCFEVPMKLHHPARIAIATVSLLLTTALPGFARPAEIIGRQSGSTVNVRQHPSRRAETISTVYVGEYIDVIDAARGRDGYVWYRLSLPDNVRGWVRQDYVNLPGIGGALEDFRPTTGVLYSNVVGDTINVRSGPSKDYNVRFAGLHGDKVWVERIAPDRHGEYWLYVKYPQAISGVPSSGWVHLSLIKLLD
jgi:SH3-like domain-containing protein